MKHLFTGVKEVIVTAIFISIFFVLLFLAFADPTFYLPTEIGLPDWMFDKALIEYLPSFILLMTASIIFVGLWIALKEI